MGYVYVPAIASGVALAIYLRSALETRRLSVGHPLVRTPDVAYAIDAALRGQPLLLVVCWSCLRSAVTVFRRRHTDAALRWLGDRLDVIESHERLSAWWSDHVTYTRALARASTYRPRHSREALEVDLRKSDVADIVWSIGWRTYWAEWPTQFWPTLATDGSAYATVDATTSIESFGR